MFERFSDGARRVVVLAQEESRLLNHNYIGTEHILLGLVRVGDGVAADALASLGVSLEALRARVLDIIGEGPRVPAGHIPFTPRAKQVLELSLREALQLGHNYIGTEHILLGLVREGEGVGAQVLVQLGADLGSVRQAVIAVLSGRVPFEPPPQSRIELRTMHAAQFAAPVPQCSFCGRDLWDVDRYVRGDAGVICDSCVTESQAAFAAAAEDQRVVTLPARIFGPQPDDPATASSISTAFAHVFGGIGTPEERMQLIEDGEAVQPFMTRAAESLGTMVVTGVRVSRIRLRGPDQAEVRFTIDLRGGPGSITHDGLAIRRDGKWLVSRTTIAEVIAPTGLQLPPPDDL
jgi:hypothetical protein